MVTPRGGSSRTASAHRREREARARARTLLRVDSAARLLRQHHSFDRSRSGAGGVRMATLSSDGKSGKNAGAGGHQSRGSSRDSGGKCIWTCSNPQCRYNDNWFSTRRCRKCGSQKPNDGAPSAGSGSGGRGQRSDRHRRGGKGGEPKGGSVTPAQEPQAAAKGEGAAISRARHMLEQSKNDCLDSPAVAYYQDRLDALLRERSAGRSLLARLSEAQRLLDEKTSHVAKLSKVVDDLTRRLEEVKEKSSNVSSKEWQDIMQQKEDKYLTPNKRLKN